MSKNWSTVCITCRELDLGQRWETKTENQANQIKAIHESSHEGHEARVTFDG